MTVAEKVASPSSPAADRLDARAVLVVVGCCAAWGVNQVAIKVANAGIPPVLQVGLRSAFALISPKFRPSIDSSDWGCRALPIYFVLKTSPPCCCPGGLDHYSDYACRMQRTGQK